MKRQCFLYFLLLTLKIIFYKKELQRSESCDSHSGATGPIHGKCSWHRKTSTAISIFQKHLNFRAVLSFKLKYKYILLKTCCVLTFKCQTRQKQDTIGDVLFLYLFDFENVENKNIHERDWLYVIQTVIH